VRIAIQENLLPRGSLRDKFALAEKLGFEGIEIWGHNIEERLSEIMEIKQSFRVAVSTICSGYRGDLLGLEREERELAIRDIKVRLEAASKLEAVGVIVVPTFGKPKLPDPWPLYERIEEFERRLLIAELKELGKYADDVGAFILLEPLNRYETHFINRLEQAVDICNEVEIEHVKIMADFFHMNIEEASIPESLRRAGGYLRHIHLADSNRLAPGFGHTDFKGAFKALKEIDYRYFMAFECRIPRPIEESIRKSLAYLRSLM